MVLEQIDPGIHVYPRPTPSRSGHRDGPPAARPSLPPPPYSESGLVMDLRDCASFTSPYEEPNPFWDGGCALPSIINLAQILLLEMQTYRDVDLISGIHHPRFRKSVVLVYNEQVANKMLAADELCEVPSFRRLLRLLSSKAVPCTHKAFYGLLYEMRDESSKMGVSVGALITREVETITIVSIATGDAFPDHRHVYAIFSTHARLDDQSRGAATIFFPTVTSAATCLYELLDATEIHGNHPDLGSDATLSNCTARLFTASVIGSDGGGGGDAYSSPATSPLPSTESVSPASPGPEDRPYDYAIHVYSFRSGSGTVLEPNSTSSTPNVLRKLHDDRAHSRQTAQNNYLETLRDELAGTQANGINSLPLSQKGKEREIQNIPVLPKVDGPNRQHSLYAGITSDDSRYPAAARPALIDPTPLATAPQHVTWDAAIDPDLVPLIVESDRPEDARKLALLEEKYAKRHANTIPNRLRRQQLVDVPEEVPLAEIHPEPYPAPPKQVKKSISSLFHGNKRAPLNERPAKSRMVVPPPDINPPRPSPRNNTRTRNDDDPELAQILRQIEQDERRRQQEEEDLGLALALSLQMDETSLASPVNDDAFVSLMPATSPPRPVNRRRPPARIEEPTFHSIYDEDETPFANPRHHRTASPEIQEEIMYQVEEPRPTYHPDRRRSDEPYDSGPLLRAVEECMLEEQRMDADREFALRLQEEEAELETANARFIDSFGQQEVFDCVMCMETNPMDDVAVVDGCNHRFCRDCLRQYLTTKLSEANFPIPCPTCSANKNQENPGEISAFLAMQLGITEQQYEMWNRFDLARISVTVECPHCRQSSLVDREEFQASRMGVCPLPTCRREWCKRCNVVVDPAAGPHSCDGQQEMEGYIRDARIQRCPGCSTPIERTAGCDHMTCRVPGCGTHFSYSTGRRM